jgi:hypothetical protein
MTGQKPHKVNKAGAGAHGIHSATALSRRRMGQTEGQFAKDPKGRKGQYGGAGDSPLTKK